MTVRISMDQEICLTSFTQFTVLEEKPPHGYMWSGEETGKTASDIQARLFMASNAKLNEKQKWSNEKPKLDNAGRLRGLNFVDPGDKEFKVTILGMLERNWKHPIAPAVPGKTFMKNKHGEIRSKNNK